MRGGMALDWGSRGWSFPALHFYTAQGRFSPRHSNERLLGAHYILGRKGRFTVDKLIWETALLFLSPVFNLSCLERVDWLLFVVNWHGVRNASNGTKCKVSRSKRDELLSRGTNAKIFTEQSAICWRREQGSSQKKRNYDWSKVYEKKLLLRECTWVNSLARYLGCF